MVAERREVVNADAESCERSVNLSPPNCPVKMSPCQYEGQSDVDDTGTETRAGAPADGARRDDGRGGGDGVGGLGATGAPAAGGVSAGGGGSAGPRQSGAAARTRHPTGGASA